MWPVEYPLTIATLKNRVDIARMKTYEKFITCIDREDFYIVDLLNIFLSLVQQPLNFAIVDADCKIKAHFCNDKEHYSGFLDALEVFFVDMKKSNEPNDIGDCLFPLFPALDLNLYVVPVLMNTKLVGDVLESNYSRYMIIENDNCKYNVSYGVDARDLELEKDLVLGGKDDSYSVLKKYVSIVAWLYFVEEWDAHKTLFVASCGQGRGGIKEMIKTSIDNIAANESKPTPEYQVVQNKTISNFDFPNRTDSHQGDWLGYDWNRTLKKRLYNVVNDRDYGLQLLSGVNHMAQDFDYENEWPLSCVNMLLGYRSYTRSDRDVGRHENANGSYNYDVSFLAFDNQNSPYVSYFRKFKSTFCDAGKLSELNHSYDSPKHGRVSYRKLMYDQDTSENRVLKIYSALATRADELFWGLISTEEGIDKIIEVLDSRESVCVRNICDPVFHTGLIHYNNIFRFYGFDRIAGLHDRLVQLEEESNTVTPEKDMNKFIESIGIENLDIDHELLKLASLYYLFSGMAARDGKAIGRNPRSLAAVLIPVKVRGVVWGVGVHATYHDNPVDSISACKQNKLECNYPFYSHQTWSFIYMLTVSIAEHYSRLIDQVLWRNALNRVHDVIRDTIGRVDLDDFDSAIAEASRKLEAEQRVIPYSLPLLSFEKCSEIGGRSNSMHGVYEVEGSGDRFPIYWRVQDNVVFQPQQEWKYKGSRSFRISIEYGLHDGIAALRRRYGWRQ